MSIGLLFEETLSSRISPFIALFHLVLFVKQFKQRFVRSPYLSFSSSEIDNPYSFRVTFENTSFIRMIPILEPSLCRYHIWTPTITHKQSLECYFELRNKNSRFFFKCPHKIIVAFILPIVLEIFKCLLTTNKSLLIHYTRSGY